MEKLLTTYITRQLFIYELFITNKGKPTSGHIQMPHQGFCLHRELTTPDTQSLLICNEKHNAEKHNASFFYVDFVQIFKLTCLNLQNQPSKTVDNLRTDSTSPKPQDLVRHVEQFHNVDIQHDTQHRLPSTTQTKPYPAPKKHLRKHSMKHN